MRKTIDFLLHDWLRVGELTSRRRFADHSPDTFDSVLSACERVAAEYFAPANRAGDVAEPRLENGVVVLPETSRTAVQAYVDLGMLAAAQDYEWGGMQLPFSVHMAANTFFSKASVALGGGPSLTAANANLLLAHGTPLQRRVFARAELEGRWAGTMCLSETQAGSSLSDIVTRAIPDGEAHDADPLGARYRLHGTKMWISNGDHEFNENIVHLVLAKVPGPDGTLPAGTKGISLFIVPKHLVDAAGSLTGERNDVVTAGLNHKLGFRGIPNTLLNFGEGRHLVRGAAGAIGYLVGRPGEGLRCMFHMMNEARIAVGLGAVSLGLAGYEASLAYARERRQGRPVGPGGKDVSAPQIPIIEHADVRRMLLVQKVYCEGGLALALRCASLLDEVHTGEAANAAEAALLLDILTPIVKSWPSQWCLEANSLAIQIHGGYGYTRDFPVEQYWRDNRLNMIHEGTHGIQGLDLLGRKAVADHGRALAALLMRMRATAAAAGASPDLADMATALRQSADLLEQTTQQAWSAGTPESVLANATAYLEGAGHVVMGWIWLDLALAAVATPADSPAAPATAHRRGLLQAARYFFAHELPRVPVWLAPVALRNPVVLEMCDDWF